MASWAHHELSTADLGDQRLNQRFATVVESLSSHPSKSLPAACGTWSETKAAYRLLEQDIHWEKLLEPHSERTLERANKHPTVLCLQDTTELDFNGRNAKGLGKLNYAARRGMYVHPTLMVTPERLPLGLTDAWTWARTKEKAPKESIRWAEGMRNICDLSQQVPDARLVYVGDREADMFELYKYHQSHPAIDWLIRGKHDRVLAEGGKLKQAAMQAPVLGQISFTKNKGRGKQSRDVVQQIRAARVTLKKDNLPLTVVLAEEVNPPDGCKAVNWLLLSNLEVPDLSKAEELLNWYLCRWEIELFFKILKSGCQVEAAQLRSKEKLERLLILKMIVAWRILYLTRLNGAMPESSCELAFEPQEWQIIYATIRKKRPPKQAPTIREMIRMIASLGGFLGRKSDGEPGIKSLWQGLERCQERLMGAEIIQSLKA